MNREEAVKLLELLERNAIALERIAIALERIAIALEGKPKTGKPNKLEGGEK